MPSVRASFAWLVVALGFGGVGLAACGGGGGGTAGSPGGGGPSFQTVDITADALNSGFTSGAGALTVTNVLNVGDDVANVDLRAHLSFVLSGVIPANATIQLAALRCTQLGVGGNPYGELGTLDVDHVDQGPGLDPGDHLVAPLTANVGALSANATAETKVLVVTNQVIADLAALRPNSDFRLQFTVAPSADGNPDMAFLSGAGAGEELVLRVTYTTP
jgi:hypothetical protein